MAIRLDDDEPADVPLAPLIDCVFLLITFFLVATTMKAVRRELPVELPPSVTAVAAPSNIVALVIGIDREGRLSLDGEAVGVTALRARLRAVAAARGPAACRVRIDGDRAAPLQSAVDVLDACRAEGVSAVGLQSRREP